MNRASAAVSASATPTRTCWASSTWSRRAPASASSTLAATQLPSGGAYHQYQPLTKRGNNDIGGNFNDDPHWLIVGVAAYLKETGDWSILDEPVPYENQPGSEQPLYEHLQRSFRYTLDRLGPHGLPLIGRADWNDCLNLNCFSDTPGQSFQTTTNKDGKVAESVFIAALFVLAAPRNGGDRPSAAGWQKRHPTIWRRWPHGARPSSSTAGTANGSCAPTTISARRSGSKECEEGKIFIEPQGFCVLAGIGLEDGKAAAALESVREHLATPHGIVLQQPAYSRYYSTWARSPPTRPGTRRTPASSATTIPG